MSCPPILALRAPRCGCWSGTASSSVAADPAAAFLAFREHAQSLVLPRRRIAEMRDALLERLVLGLIARGGARTAWLICY